jgi:hypothetical protein
MVHLPIVITLLFLVNLRSTTSLSNSQNRHLSYGSVLASNTGSDGIVNANANSKTSNKDHIWQYWCDTCACGFNKLKSYNEHVSGKRHNAVAEESERVWQDYNNTSNVFYDPAVSRADITRAWSLDLFVNGLPARSRSSLRKTVATTAADATGQLDPGLMVRDLSPIKRAALWRYLRDAGLSDMVAVLPPQYARVKELLESVEAFSHVERLVKRSTQNKVKATRISHLYDVGCGHGLVGMLCAMAFPTIQVHALDREPRLSFCAQRDAFVSSGTALDNLTFQAGDLSDLVALGKHDDDDKFENDSLLLCVHGCKSLTHESIELAARNKWAWLVLPCCLQSEHHLETTVLKLPDDIRFALLCGVLAAKHKAETVAYINPRITARGIVLSSSG